MTAVQAQLSVLDKIARYKEIQKQKEELKEKLQAIATPIQEKIKELEKEEEEIRAQIEKDTIMNPAATIKNSKSGVTHTLSFPGVATISASIKEEFVITDEEEAKKIIEENPIFFDAQKVSLNKKKFLEIALDIYQETGELIHCVEKQQKIITKIIVPKDEENE